MPPSTLRILLIDDNEADATLIRSILEQIHGAALDLEWAATPSEGLTRLQANYHDVCLADYLMEAGTGLDLLRQARSLGVRTPVILLTGKGSREVDLEAMRTGAVDYLIKGEMDPATLERSIRYAVQLHRDREALRRSEERNRSLFEHLPLGLFRVGPGGEFMEANPALVRTLDFPDRHTLHEQMAPSFFVAPRDRERFLQSLEDHGMVSGLETRVPSGSGRILRLRVTARLHRGPGGRPEYVEGSVENLTGIRSSGDVEEEAACWRVHADMTSAGVALLDPDGHLRRVNPGLAALLDEDRDTLDGRGVWTLVRPEDQDRVGRTFESVASGERDRAREDVRLRSSSPNDRSFTLSLAAITGRGGTLHGLLLLVEPASPAGGGGP